MFFCAGPKSFKFTKKSFLKSCNWLCNTIPTSHQPWSKWSKGHYNWRYSYFFHFFTLPAHCVSLCDTHRPIFTFKTWKKCTKWQKGTERWRFLMHKIVQVKPTSVGKKFSLKYFRGSVRLGLTLLLELNYFDLLVL